MTKKSTHWVTIPEEAIHTPASGATKKSEKMNSKNKLFWGASFVVLVMVTAALLAPQQLASVLQGNLFEQSGFEPLAIIPEEEPSEELVEEPSEEVVVEAEDVIAVEAETEAVSIQIEPIVAEEEVVEEEVVEEEAVEEEVVEEPVEEVVTGGIKEELDANRKLLEELSQQIADFKEKDDQKTEIIEDLTEIVQDTLVRPSAPTVVSPAVTSTTAIGQIPTGYRVNTHTVVTTPHQVLQQASAQLQMQQTSIVAAASVQDYSEQLSQASSTPDSGPKEAMLLTLSLVFIALLGWKIGKLARA